MSTHRSSTSFAAAANLLLSLVTFALIAEAAHAQTTPYLYFTNRDGQVVKAIDADGTSSTFLSSAGLPSSLFGAALDTSGNLYVSVSTNTSTDRIVKITPAGVLSTFYAFGTTQSPTDLTFDSDGNLYVGSQGGGTFDIFKITPGGVLSTFATGGTYLNRPFGLAFGNDGYLYVSNYGGQNITRFDSGGNGEVWATLPAASNPFGIAFDNSGNLLVVRSNANTIDRITPGKVETTIASITNGSGLTFDPVSGTAYVISQGNKVYEVAPDGSSTSLFSTLSDISGQSYGLVNANVNASAVPEPATYAALAGLAALGLAIHRRRRTA